MGSNNRNSDAIRRAGREAAQAVGMGVGGGPLVGLRILEIGHFIAAPFAARLLADLGAEVIKIEPPGGDPIRQWGAQVNGRSVWWSMHARNKKSVELDLKTREGREALLRLVPSCDAVIENLRPGQLEKLGVGPDVLRARRPDLVIARVSGFGQDGPYRDRAAFGVIGEAMGGLRYLTDHPPGTSALPPVRVGVSIGDSVAGLYAALGVMSALWARDRRGGDGRARTLDVALTESVLSLMEGMLPEYGVLGRIRQPTGSAIPTAAPSNAYRTVDGWILIAANSEPLFMKLARAMGRDDLLSDCRFFGNQLRCAYAGALDAEIGAWTAQLTTGDAERLLTEADIPNCRVYTAADCAQDPQFIARGMIRNVEDPLLGHVMHAGVVPHIPEDPGTIRWSGPQLGQHDAEILGAPPDSDPDATARTVQ
jgi:crotonobetainyl-CoA:carnitine CoA-transferase CaiB-like acyl-CoA transferase